MDNKELYNAVRGKYGDDTQLTVAIEEMSELIKELCKYKRNGVQSPAIAEEMADVEIMLEQLRLIFRNGEVVDSYKAYKLARLEKRLGG